jgi:glucosylceramidase
VESVAFRNADDGSTAVLVVNSANATRPFSVRSAGKVFRYALPAGAVATFVWK